MNKGKLYTTKKAEGMEQPCVLVVFPTPTGNYSHLCHAWGIEEGLRYFDTTADNRIILSENAPFMLHCPNVGMTYELDGSTRELRHESSLVVN